MNYACVRLSLFTHHVLSMVWVDRLKTGLSFSLLEVKRAVLSLVNVNLRAALLIKVFFVLITRIVSKWRSTLLSVLIAD